VQKGLNILTLPKTIGNDVAMTDVILSPEIPYDPETVVWRQPQAQAARPQLQQQHWPASTYQSPQHLGHQKNLQAPTSSPVEYRREEDKLRDHFSDHESQEPADARADGSGWHESR
jgi:hypothetical protein